MKNGCFYQTISDAQNSALRIRPEISEAALLLLILII